MWVAGHVCVCVCLCHRVHVSVYVTYMQACASASWLSVHVCMCVPQARQSMLLLGSSPLSPQRPQCVWVQVCDQSHVDQSWCQGSSGSDSHSPLYLSLSLSPSPSHLSPCPISRPLSLLLLSILFFDCGTVGMLGQKQAYRAPIYPRG